MKLTWQQKLQQQPRLILEEAGYHAFFDRQSGKSSFVMRMARGFYPRYHLYLKESPAGIILDLHVDQKKASQVGQTAHSGEYDGPIVEEELQRLQRWLEHYSSPR